MSKKRTIGKAREGPTEIASRKSGIGATVPDTLSPTLKRSLSDDQGPKKD